jgi:hypothetical protein
MCFSQSFPLSWELYVHNGRYSGLNIQQHILVLFCCILPYIVSCGGFIVKGNTEGTHAVKVYCKVRNITSPRLDFVCACVRACR